MPFDGSGNFARVHNWQSDRDNGIRILAARMDTECDNLAAGLNVVFFRNGLVPMSGNINMGQNYIIGLGAGSAAALSMRFADDPNTGIFLDGYNRFAIGVNGVKRAVAHTGGFDVFGISHTSGNQTVGGNSIVTGVVSAANFSGADAGFIVGSPDFLNGMRVIGVSDTVDFITNNVSRMAITNTGVNIGVLTLTNDLAIADGGTGASTAAQARTNLGLGTMAVQNANTVNITGGTGMFTGQVTGLGIQSIGDVTTRSFDSTEVVTVGGVGQIRAINGAGSGYLGLDLVGADIRVKPGGTLRLLVDGTGANVTGTLNASSTGSVVSNFTVNGSTSIIPKVDLSPNTAVYSELAMRGVGGNAALGLDILAGAGGAFYSADTHTIRNAAQSVNFGVFNSTGLAVTGTITPTGPYNVLSTSYFKGNSANGYRFNNQADTLNLLTILDTGASTFNVSGVQRFQVNATGADVAGTLSATTLTLTNDLAVAQGGTGASDAATARTNLGAANIAGAQFTGATGRSGRGGFLHHSSASFSDPQITFSTAAPSGGADGDLWFQYT